MADERPAVLEVGGVAVTFRPEVPSLPNNTVCNVLLCQMQIKFVGEGGRAFVLHFRQMKSIQIHQPIFGANYITGEYTDQGVNATFTLTFSKGGATEFARSFFRLTEGHLVTDEPATAGSNSQPGSDEPQAQQPTADQEDKKNR